METTRPLPEYPFKSLVLAAATGHPAPPHILGHGRPTHMLERARRWVTVDLEAKGLTDITGSLAWWRATLRQLDAELRVAPQQDEPVEADAP